MKNNVPKRLVVSIIITIIMATLSITAFIGSELKFADIYLLYTVIGVIFSLHYAAERADYMNNGQ